MENCLWNKGYVFLTKKKCSLRYLKSDKYMEGCSIPRSPLPVLFMLVFMTWVHMNEETRYSQKRTVKEEWCFQRAGPPEALNEIQGRRRTLGCTHLFEYSYLQTILPRNGTAGPHGNFTFNFLRNLYTVLHNGSTNPEKTVIQKDTRTPISIAALFTKKPRHGSNLNVHQQRRGWGRSGAWMLYNRILLSHKKKRKQCRSQQRAWT